LGILRSSVIDPQRTTASALALFRRRLLSVKRMSALALGAACLAFGVAACRKEGPPRQVEKGAAALRALVRFRPPADGLLTPEQLDRYVRVRRVARGRTEAEAARAVGVDSDEYSWVRARVIEALVALDTRRTRAAS